MYMRHDILNKFNTSAYAFTSVKLHNRSALKQLTFESGITPFSIKMNKASNLHVRTPPIAVRHGPAHPGDVAVLPSINELPAVADEGPTGHWTLLHRLCRLTHNENKNKRRIHHSTVFIWTRYRPQTKSICRRKCASETTHKSYKLHHDRNSLSARFWAKAIKAQMEIAYNQVNIEMTPSELDQNDLTNGFTSRKFVYKITPMHKIWTNEIIQIIRSLVQPRIVPLHHCGRRVERAVGGWPNYPNHPSPVKRITTDIFYQTRTANA